MRLFKSSEAVGGIRILSWAHNGPGEGKHIEWREEIAIKAVHAVCVVNRIALSLALSRDFASSGCTCLLCLMELTSTIHMECPLTQSFAAAEILFACFP